MRKPGGGTFYAPVADIPEGLKLEDFGPEAYLLELKEMGAGTNFGVISNELISLKDGTKAFETAIKRLWNDGKTWITTTLVSAYREDKLVYLTTHTAANPEEVAWIVESLTFQ